MKIRLAEMTWPEVEDVLGKPNAIILPVGSTEQHGWHLPLSVDSDIATYLSEQAARKVGKENKFPVVVAPCLDYTETSGFSFPLSGYPGTIGLSMNTVISVMEDIVRGFLAMGFKNIILVNGHYSNSRPIPVALQNVHIDFPDSGLYAVNWWALGSQVITGIRKSKMSLHAEEVETSICLVIQPDKVQLDKAVKWEPNFSLSRKWAVPDFYGPSKLLFHSRRDYPYRADEQRPGVMGDPTVASRETGEKIISAVVGDLAEIIVEVVVSEGTDRK